MGLLTGLLGGVNRTMDAGRQRAREDEDKQFTRETNALTLLTNSDDPEIADAAVSALVERASGAKTPKGGYLQRLIGVSNDRVHPAVAGVMQLIRTPPSSGGGTPGAAGQPAGGRGGTTPAPAPVRSAVPPPVGGAAQPATSATQPGGGPAANQPMPGPPQVPTGVPGGEGPGTMPTQRAVQPPPQVNAPPDAVRAAAATSAPEGVTNALTGAGGPPQVPGGGAGMAGGGVPPAGPMGGNPMAGINMGGPPMVPPPPPNFTRHVFLSPGERQRQTNQIHAEGIAMDLESKVNAGVKLLQSRGAGPEEVEKYVRTELGLTKDAGIHEGEIVPDAKSPTGYAQVMYTYADGKLQEVGRLPAHDPQANRAPVNYQKDFITSPGKDKPYEALFDPNGADSGYYDIDTKQRIAGAQGYQKPTAAPGDMSDAQKLKATTDLTKQWETATKPLRDVQRQMGIMETGMKSARAGNLAQAGQMLLVTFQKILDAESVVRTEEYKRSAAGLAMDARIRGFIEQLEKGGAGVPVDELEKFAQAAREIVQSQQQNTYLQGTRRRIEDTAEEFGVNPKLVFYDDTTGATVRMRDPKSGVEKDVPLSEVDFRKSQGAVEVPRKKSGGEQK